MPVQDHIHLQGTDDQPWSTDGAPDNTYSVLFPKLGRMPRAWVATEMALNGTLHVYQLVDDAGDLIQRDDYRPVLQVTDTELTELLTERGKKVDFVPPTHPDAGSSHAAYVTEMVLKQVLSVREVDPMLNYHWVSLVLEASE